MQTVVYERWYLEEQARNARRRGERLAPIDESRQALPSRRIDKRNPDPRTALAAVIDATRASVGPDCEGMWWLLAVNEGGVRRQ